MLLLTSTSDILRVVTNSAANLDIHADWVDNASGTITPGRTNTAISSATTTTVVGSPAASTQRNLQTLTGTNRHASLADTITIQHFDGTTSIDLFATLVLGPGEHFEWLDGVGFRLFDNRGNEKMTINVAGRWLKTTVLISGTSFTTQNDTRTIYCRIWAGGGGGGACTTAITNSAAAGGGSSGGYAEKMFTVQGNTAYIYAIGGGGGSGAAGGISTFAVAGVTVTANAGLAGANQTVAAPPLVSLGGATPAVSTNGDLNGGGSVGGGGNCAAAAIAISGSGGNAEVGGGGLGRTSQGNGNAAIGRASGGGGACILSGGASTTGGAGSAGVIIVDEYA
jgi:hypothetical protein